VKLTTSRVALGLASLMTLVAVLQAGVEEAPSPGARRDTAARKPDVAAAQRGDTAMPELDLARFARKPAAEGGEAAPAKDGDGVTDAFEARSWLPPPPPPKKVEPQAPPLAFKYFGKIVDGGQVVVFLSRNERSFAVRAGDTLDAQYRVDAISDTGMTLTYLPLNVQQTLQIGSSQ
jgi:hypothetical protein